MGFEYRLHLDPPLADLALTCEALFSSSEWRRIPTALVDVPAGIGVRGDGAPLESSWPQDADLFAEDERTIFVVCHGSAGQRFTRALIVYLRSSGYVVTVDDDV